MAETEGRETSISKHGEFCWAELATTDLTNCKEFFKNVFGWEVPESRSEGVGGVKYQEFNLPGEYPMGGMFDMKHIYGENPPPPHFMNYLAVDDIDETAARVEGLGGKLMHPAKDIPNVGRMVTIQDPTGAAVTLITLKVGEHHG